LPTVKSIKPPAWSVEKMAAGFIYFEDEPGGAQRQSY
jgi:hypothetical protein